MPTLNFAALLPVLLETFKAIGKMLAAAGIDIKAEMDAMLQEVKDTQAAESAAEASEEADFNKRPAGDGE